MSPIVLLLALATVLTADLITARPRNYHRQVKEPDYSAASCGGMMCDPNQKCEMSTEEKDEGTVVINKCLNRDGTVAKESKSFSLNCIAITLNVDGVTSTKKKCIDGTGNVIPPIDKGLPG